MEYQGNAHLIRYCPTAREPLKRISRNPANPDYGTADETWIWRTNSNNSSGINGYQGTYSYNGWLYYDLSWEKQKVFTKESAIESPSETPFLGDAMWVDSWPLATDRPARNLYEGDGVAGGIGRYCIARHAVSSARAAPRKVAVGTPLPGTVNIACMDGHVETVKLDKLWDLRWHAGYVPPVSRPK